MNAHAVRTHKRYAASAAERWMTCPGSVRLCESIPAAPPSAYALEGTQAAEMLEAALTTNCLMASSEMTDAVMVAVNHAHRLMNEGSTVFSETQVEVPSIEAPNEVGGTADIIAYNPKTKTLRVDDYKHGSGVYVEVVGNKQTRIYALGALLWLAEWRVEHVVLGVIQPRVFHPDGEPIHEEQITVAELLDFQVDVEEAIRRSKGPDAPLVPGEEQCRWCPAKLICPAREKQALVDTADAFSGATVVANGYGPSPERIGEVLAMKDQVLDWFKAYEEEAYRLAMSGVSIPGQKLVAAVGRRQWQGETWDVAHKLAALTSGALPRDFVETSLIGITEAEKKLKPYKIPTELTKKSGGKLQLVPESDNRPAVSPAAEAFESVKLLEMIK